MTADNKVIDFLSQYNEQVFNKALKLREVLFDNLPDIIEQLDIPAEMVAYCYGQNNKLFESFNPYYSGRWSLR